MASTPTPAPEPPIPIPPDRDLTAIARRLGRSPGSAPAAPSLAAEPGSQRTFHIAVLPPGAVGGDALPSMREATATLLAVSEHGLFYWELGLEPPQPSAEQAARLFEEVVRPTVTPVFGEQRAGGEGRIVVLHADLGGGAGGYFSDADEAPAWVYPYSNEASMVYLDASISPESPAYAPLLAHEYQHLVQFAADPSEDSWVNEGLSEVAAQLAGPYGGRRSAFLDDPRLQLNEWSGDGLDYGKSHLWFDYLMQRFGGTDIIAAVASEPEDGVAGVRAVLARYGATFEDVVVDWAVANLLDAPSGPYAYPEGDVSVTPLATLTPGERLDREVPQFAADYIAIRSAGPVTVTFEGEAEAPVLPAVISRGQGVWWSNRGDAIDTALTRAFDLSSVATATLTFRTWFDIERGWDYGYVEASADGGRTWRILRGLHSTDLNPVGNAFGPGYTGTSGRGPEPAWVEERIDLSPFAGQSVLVRFEYVTDGGFHHDGWAIGDVRVPEIGFADPAGTDQGWRAEGFARLDRPLAQRFALRLAQGDLVRPVEVDASGRARFDVDGTSDPVTLIVVPLTDGTAVAARYTLSAALR